MAGFHDDRHGAAVADAFVPQESHDSSSGQGGSLQDAELAHSLDQALGHSHNDAPPPPSGRSTSDGGYTQHDGDEGKSDTLTGDDGNDFISAGQKRIELSGSGTGPDEFPFPNDSPGEMSATAVLEEGRLKIDGSFSNFDAVPLFEAEGVNERAAEDATVFSNDAPQDLVNRFRADAESKGFEPTGVHLHFSPEQEADATIIRTLSVEQNDAKSGTISGDFALTPEEQAAASAARSDGGGLFYLNNHTNVNADGDDRGGFLNGEVRLNLNPISLDKD